MFIVADLVSLKQSVAIEQEKSTKPTVRKPIILWNDVFVLKVVDLIPVYLRLN